MGDKVLLRLQPHPRFYGPFTILERVGSMAYKLDLPPDSKIHPVFHVSKLKRYHVGPLTTFPVLPSIPPDAPIYPLAILDHRVKGGIPEVLVHWSNSSPADASWEKVQGIFDKFLDFKLADKLPLGKGSNVTKPLQVYTRFTHGARSKEPRIEFLN
ncbi:hypothetical protein K2173_020588 [Erythroxylum novogranatense]|uniref:Tf2-1-like SH3-like domain-containing protein n=1 Tax=Erythroxylum novogranatense TaxID=1862640 RepID=A0AAV8TGR6_9ROSI|nr:hypothetical protein K2173_020588 [Erythroxylum novogranatense]